MAGIVIVGAGECGTRAAFAARDAGYDGAILLIAGEAGLPYDRTKLTKPIVPGEAPFGGLSALRKPICHANQLDAAGITLLAGTPVGKVNSDARQVTLTDGRVFGYDRLLLAVGATARRLACRGGDRALGFRTIDHAQTVFAKARGKVVIAGAGLIGLELAAVLSGQGAEVTLVEAEALPLSRTVPAGLAERLMARHQAEGVRLLCGSEIEKVTPGFVTLSNGKRLPAPSLIAAIGVVPNTTLGAMAGAMIDNGICVDAQMRTSVPGIYAAGDCANVTLPNGQRVRSETWRCAMAQGIVAGQVMAGQTASYDDPNWLWSDQYDLTVQVVGQVADRPDALRQLPEAELQFSIDSDGALIGVAGIGRAAAMTKDIILAQRLIRAGAKVTARALSDPAIDLKSLLRTQGDV